MVESPCAVEPKLFTEARATDERIPLETLLSNVDAESHAGIVPATADQVLARSLSAAPDGDPLDGWDDLAGEQIEDVVAMHVAQADDAVVDAQLGEGREVLHRRRRCQ